MLDALIALGLATVLVLGLLPLVADGAMRVRRAREDTTASLAVASLLAAMRAGNVPLVDADCLSAGETAGAADACQDWLDTEGHSSATREGAVVVRRWRVTRRDEGAWLVVACAAPVHDGEPGPPGATAAPCAAAVVRRSGGFTLTELLVAAAVLAVAAALLAPAVPLAQARLETDTAAAETAQRLRATALGMRELAESAGGGLWLDGGAALARLPALWPAWPGATEATEPALTVVAGRWNAAQARLPNGAPAGARWLAPEADGLCAAALPACGFAAGDTLLVADTAGAVAVAAVQRVESPLTLVLARPLGIAIGPGAVVVQADVVSLPVRPDGDAWQILRAVGAAPAQPWVDHVTRVELTWWAGAGTTAPVPLAPSALSDGPWLPHADAPGRWDADLRRVAFVRVRIALRAAAASLRWGVDLPGGSLRHPVPDLVTDITLVTRRARDDAKWPSEDGGQ